MAIMLLAVVGCSTGVPDRRADAEALAGRIRALPGVVAATSNSAHSQAQGLIYVRIGVEVTDDITADQVADITTHYLHGIATGTFTGYQLELDVRRGGTSSPSTAADCRSSTVGRSLLKLETG